MVVFFDPSSPFGDKISFIFAMFCPFFRIETPFYVHIQLYLIVISIVETMNFYDYSQIRASRIEETKMKTNRPTVVLHMAFQITDKGSFQEKQVCTDLAISRSSFFRALSEFRCYLQEHQPWYDLVFDSKDDCYRVTDLRKPTN